MLEEACSRAGIPPEGITGEIVEKFLTQVNLTLTSLLNRGIQLWKRQQLILPCDLGVNQVAVPAGWNLVTTLNRRSMFRQIGTSFFSDQGGTPALAFDDDFDTACTQTAINGAVGCIFATPTVVTNVGVLSGSSGNWALFVEYSPDGVTWTAVDAVDVQFTTAKQWSWFDLQGSPITGALQWRIRSVGTAPFSVAEIFFGNTPQEIPLGNWNIDDYNAMPNKWQGGQVLNWYQQRNISSPLIYVWPTPDSTARYDSLTTWSTQYLDQVTNISQSLDLPLRWYDAVTAMVARRLCRTIKEADAKRYSVLLAEEQEAVMLAQQEERDPSPTNYDLGVWNYTR
jgi:hypothetical protein